ncbi:peptidase M20 [Planctobacterium marinum]|uniref:Peptidase M20 n=1 Tax=Planctobacterium marinum TaxID=1631968 RepID=A0AA48KRG9_9ALTE|nr:peptidase M20 [Planctobacterium marinum]
MTKLNFIVFCALSFVFGNNAAQANADTEARILSLIESYQLKARQLLRESVAINSGTMNFDGVKLVAEHLKEAYLEAGIETEWLPGDEFGRAGHLTAQIGTHGVKFVLIGHLDTVFSQESEFQAYQEVDEFHHKGPGITDMKGGNVIMLHVLKALKESGALQNMQVKVILTGDEEKSGKPLRAARAALIEAAKWADVAIGFEDGDSDPRTAVIARRGAISWTLSVKGRPAHSSQIFREGYGDGAIYEAARILNTFRERLASLPNLTFNPGLIVGGTESHIGEDANATAFGKANVIAQTVKVKGDLRALSPEQLSLAKSTMLAITQQNLALTSAELVFNEGYPPLAPTEGNKKLLALFNQISLELGYGTVEAVNPRNAGAADISFTSGHVLMAIDGLGLMGDGGHTIHETADMRTFEQNMKRAALLMYRVANSSNLIEP